MNSRYTSISIIYNPFSTSGRAEIKATRLQKQLARRDIQSKLYATEYAGHAEVIAYECAIKDEHPLIVSVSGDGGYNEVINGVMRAKRDERAHQPVCAILAAGNANDHRNAVKKSSLLRGILQSEPEAMDILKLHATNKKITLLRYAHSYIGLGITSKGAAALNREKLTRFKEIRIVLRTLLRFKPLVVKHTNGKREKFDSLVFSNIHQMSKVIKFGTETDLHNGLFRIIAIPHYSRARLFAEALRIGLFGFKNPPEASNYSFSVTKTELVHFDGEVRQIPNHAQVNVACVPEALLTIR
ncbi:MAG: sphingosine/diacylglycerol kinaselike enzyme [Candidatus Saccharibacteria bacterium]|nr:sphingosine/diacylglycerol kinaselike enzyme [Candidatus Saccharibacteria bacterium]